MREYRRLKERFLSGTPTDCRCKFPNCQKPAEEIHHTRGRAGTLLLDWRFWVGMCAKHHRWVGDNPVEARGLSLLCEAGQWNKPAATPIPEMP